MGTWSDRPKDFSWFWINTFSRYLGWGSAFDGDQSVKTVLQFCSIRFSRSVGSRCGRLWVPKAYICPGRRADVSLSAESASK